MKFHDLRLYIETVVLTIVALYSLIIYNFASFYSNAIMNMEELGQRCLSTETENMQGYLAKGLNTLMITANGINYMIESGDSPEEIEKFLKGETEYCQAHIDENFTGIYGYVNGTFIDGSNVKAENVSDPIETNWYKEAVKGKCAPVIVDPYIDTKTGEMITSICCLLEDKKSVLAIDLALDGIQSIVENINLNDIGYGMVITESGIIVAHADKSENGKNYIETDNKFANAIINQPTGYFSYEFDEEATVFVDNIFGQWQVALIINNSELFHDIKVILLKNLAISLTVLLLVIFFYTFVFITMRKAKKRDEQNRDKMEKLNMNIVRALAHTIDAKDRYTSGHSQRVANYSLEIAKRMGKNEEEQKEIYYAGLLHDVGKIRVPKEVINKPGRLTEEEFRQIKIHPVTGYHILKDIYETKYIAEGAKFHHERYDGKGYPNGLSGENIPEIARIIGVADAYDAMASNRSYRDALPQAKVRSEIQNGKGVQFDPKVADIMLDMINEDIDYKMRQLESTQKNILVVDDEPLTQKMIRHIMREEPMYNILGADSGGVAMRLLSEIDFDLILLDINMPEYNGFDVFTEVRKKYNIPIVFMTGDKNIETIKKAYDMGVDDYITKPFQPYIIKEVIHSVINN